MEQKYNPERYLAQHLEQDNNRSTKIREKFGNLDLLDQRAWQHFDEVSFQKEGRVYLTKNPLSLSFEYQTPPDEQVLRLDQEDQGYDWRVLKNFVIENSKNHQRLELESYCPKDLTIFFVARQENLVEGSSDADLKNCLIFGSPTSLDNVLTLLHELGHYLRAEQETRHQRYLVSRAYNDLDQSESIDPETAKIILQEERNAWAFALKILRPVLGNDPNLKASVLRMIHHYSLASYSEDIMKTLKSNLAQSV